LHVSRPIMIAVNCLDTSKYNAVFECAIDLPSECLKLIKSSKEGQLHAFLLPTPLSLVRPQLFVLIDSETAARRRPQVVTQ